MGVMLLWDLLNHARDLKAHFTDLGVLPRFAVMEKYADPHAFSIHFMSGTFFVQALLFLVAAFFATLLLVGYRTRLATAVSWFLFISLKARNPLVVYTADQLFRLLLFWGMFLPLGARFSVDSLRDPSPPKKPCQILSVGTVAYLAQGALLYTFAAYFKFGGEWKNGNAVYYALNIDIMATPAGHFLLHFPRLLKILTHAVVWFERGGPFFLFAPVFTGPVRTLTVAGFCLMQAGFSVFLTLGEFPWVSVVAMLGFLPSWFWDKVAIHAKSRLEPHLLKLRGRAVPWLETLPRRAVRIEASLAENLAALIFFAYILWWNFGTLQDVEHNMPPKYQWLGVTFQLGQQWNLYSPDPPKSLGWFVIPGRLRDGSVVDLFKNGKPLTWEKPAWASASVKNDRWLTYFSQLTLDRSADFRLYYGQYLCREWNQTHSPERQVLEFEMDYMVKTTLPDYRPPAIQKALLWHHYCFEVPPKEVNGK